VDFLPDGFSLDPDTGIISGTLTGTDEPLDVTVRATNAMGYAEHTFTWLTWDARADAKGWYDNRDTSTLKTDLVAKFDRASSESLTVPTPIANDLNFDGPFTFAAWIKGAVGGAGGNQGIVENFSSAGGYRVLILSAGTIYWEISGVGGGSYYNTAYQLTGDWQLVTLGFDGVNRVVSLDGSILHSTSHAAPLKVGGHLLLGQASNLSMAHAALWNRALTPAEITALYNVGTIQEIPSSLEENGVSYWPLWEPRGMRYDRGGSNHLTDINTVSGEHGPATMTAGEYAGITKWENQGLAASPFADVVTPTPLKSPQLLNALVTWDGSNSASLYSTTGTVTPDSAIYVVAKADSDGPPYAGLVDSDHPILRHLVYLVSDNLRLFARPNGAVSGGEHVATTNDGHARFGIYAELQPTSMTVKVGGETFQNTSATPGEMIGLSIGGYYNQSVSGSWDGTIEAVLVFDRVLMSAELAELESLYV
jgi:hypothetical protein